MVRHGKTGYLVDPNDPAEIVRRLSQLLADPEGRRTMGHAARELALERFHPASVASQTRAVYLEAMGVALPLAAPPLAHGKTVAPAAWVM